MANISYICMGGNERVNNIKRSNVNGMKARECMEKQVKV